MFLIIVRGLEEDVRGVGGGARGYKERPRKPIALVWCAGVSWLEGADAVQSSIQLTAAGLQCDSFCPDSTYPVVLQSLSSTGEGQAARSKLTPAVCASISLQVTTPFVKL